MPPRSNKVGRRVRRKPSDEQAGPVHIPPALGVSADELRVLHDLPEGYQHRADTAFDSIPV